jgi:AraC-like DNA-binding protein
LAAAADVQLNTLDADLDPLAEDDALYTFVTLAEVAGQPLAKTSHYFAAAALAREYIDDNLEQPIKLDELAEYAGRDLWNLSNDSRAFFGTRLPYLTLRRQDRVKEFALAGQALSDALIAPGFFDQNHMSRHFKNAFGLSSSRWCNPTKG